MSFIVQLFFTCHVMYFEIETVCQCHRITWIALLQNEAIFLKTHCIYVQLTLTPMLILQNF